MKNKLVAGLFAILLGSIGVQFFYLGKDAKYLGKSGGGISYGILSILFCWTGIPAIIGLIMGIIMLTMSDEEFGERYGVEVEDSGFNISGSGNSVNKRSVADEILKYKELLDKGAITETEFRKKKEELLNL